MRISLGLQTVVTTTASACLEIIAPPTRNVQIMELDITTVAATASEVGLGYPAAKGITPTLIAPLFVGDPNAVMTRVAVAWGTPPTVPTRFERRVSLANAIGSLSVWQFDDFKSDKPNGLVILAGTSIVLWNLSVVSLLDVSIVLEEKWAAW